MSKKAVSTKRARFLGTTVQLHFGYHHFPDGGYMSQTTVTLGLIANMAPDEAAKRLFLPMWAMLQADARTKMPK